MLENKYSRWYFSLVSSRKNRILSDNVYIEKHHIIPRSLGGNDSDSNIVLLTAREHFIAHLLLVKMFVGEKKIKMSFALKCMTNFQNSYHSRYNPSSRIYEISRKYAVEAISFKNTGHPGYLKKQSLESRKKISISMKETLSQLTPEQLTQRMKNSCCSLDTYTKERAKKISDALTGYVRSDASKESYRKGAIAHRNSLSLAEKKKIYGEKNAGKTWKLIDGKRVWLEKEKI